MAPLAVIDSSHTYRETSAPPDVLRAALERLPIGVMLVSPDGAVLHANPEIERLFACGVAELIGGSIEVLIPEGIDITADATRSDDSPQSRAEAIEAPRELLARRTDGSELPIELRLAPISLGETTVILVSIVDLRERRRLHAELKSLRDERLRFETLIAELGAGFVHVRPRETDRLIEEALGRLVRTLDLDRSVIFQFDGEGDFVSTHQWTRPGLAPAPRRVPAREQFPWHLSKIRTGELVSFATLEEVPDEMDREGLRRFGTKSAITVPLVTDGTVWGVVSFVAVREPRTWSPDVVERFRVVALLLANVVARQKLDEDLRLAATESAKLRERLRDENAYLRRELQGSRGGSSIVGHSPAIRRIIEQVRQLAATDSTVLVVGETGTGKARLASWIHELSARSARAMIRVDCVARNAASIQGELFGVERGSYGEHDVRRMGRLELAHLSTVVLDEIGDLPLHAQASLTRVLQDRQLQPLGGTRYVPIDIRVIATTRKDLKRCVDDGTFRGDLYDLLNVSPIHLPPLRERPEDIPLLVWRFVDEFSESFGKTVEAIDKDSMSALQRYHWPGNARELRNLVECAMIVSSGRHLKIALPGQGTRPRKEPGIGERERIAAALAAAGGKIQGKNGAAASLGLTPRVLMTRMSALGMRMPRKAGRQAQR